MAILVTGRPRIDILRGQGQGGKMARKDLSIARLIRRRMQDLGIARGKLVRRMGYANIAKGCRRIDQICGGRVEFAENLRFELAKGLEVEVNVIDESTEVTRAELIEAEDKAYRASFMPHAVILTEQNVPSQITFYAMTGGSRHRIIQFKEGSNPETYAVQARDTLRSAVPFLGAPTGYVINYTPDFALRFNKEGRLVERLSRAFRVGQSSVVVGGKKVDEKTWASLIGDVDFHSSLDVN